MSQTEQMALPIFKGISFNLLAKCCSYFENTLKPLTEKIFFELTYSYRLLVNLCSLRLRVLIAPLMFSS